MNRYALHLYHKGEYDVMIEPTDYVDSLDEMYRLCECDTIDILSISNHIPEYQKLFEGIVYDNESIDIVLDDNGKFYHKSPTLPLMHAGTMYDLIVGDIIIIVGNNDTGETYGFTSLQIIKVQRALMRYIATFKSKIKYHAVVDMSYDN